MSQIDKADTSLAMGRGGAMSLTFLIIIGFRAHTPTHTQREEDVVSLNQTRYLGVAISGLLQRVMNATVMGVSLGGKSLVPLDRKVHVMESKEPLGDGENFLPTMRGPFRVSC